MQPSNACKLFVITGGPGAGKTTLIEALQAAGLATAPEAGRAIIRSQRAISGPALPDGDRHLYAELMLCWELRSYEAALSAGAVHIFDRGIPDTIGYLRLVGAPVPPHLARAAEMFRYNETVFILPPWPAIYARDAERAQTLEEAERTYEAMRDVYTELGYRLFTLPRAVVEKRRDLVLSAVRAAVAG